MLSLSQARCLLAVYTLSEVYGRASSKSVCKLLGISKPSVHNALIALEEKGFIVKQHYGASVLTQTGEEIARELDERRTDLMMLFNRQFYLSPDQADLAAMLLICGLKEESLDKLMCTKVTVAI